MTLLAEVHWIDAHGSQDEISLDEALRDKGTPTISRGVLVAETDYGITLAMDEWPCSPGKFKISGMIPWEMIRDWYVIEI